MKGKNKIVLCEAEMREAMQHYFDHVLFREKASPRVEGVYQYHDAGEGSVCEVLVTEKHAVPKFGPGSASPTAHSRPG